MPTPVQFAEAIPRIIKTMEEIFGLPAVNNPIPTAETNVFGGYNNIATVNDLSDLFRVRAIPAPASFSVTGGNFVRDRHTGMSLNRCMSP